MHAPSPQEESFAHIAVGLAVAQSEGHADFAELAWASWVQAAFAADRAISCEVLAARIGLSEDATAHLLAAERKHRERIAEAHQLFKRLIPHEAEVRAILSRAERETKASVWARLRSKLTQFVERRRS